MSEWFRHTTWNEAIESAYPDRLHRAGEVASYSGWQPRIVRSRSADRSANRVLVVHGQNETVRTVVVSFGKPAIGRKPIANHPTQQASSFERLSREFRLYAAGRLSRR